MPASRVGPTATFLLDFLANGEERKMSKGVRGRCGSRRDLLRDDEEDTKNSEGDGKLGLGRERTANG